MSAGLLDESGPQRMIATAKATVLAGGHRELPDVEGRSGLVIPEEQVPGLFVRLDPLALQGRRQVEHHHVRLVMSEDGRNIVPADRVRPGFEKGLDPALFGVGVFRYGFGSFVRSEDERRGINPTRARGRATNFDVGGEEGRARADTHQDQRQSRNERSSVSDLPSLSLLTPHPRLRK